MTININPNDTTKKLWTAQFSNNDALDFKIMNLPLPSIEGSINKINTSVTNIALQVAGNSLTLSPITLTFRVDEDLANYIFIADWIAKNTKKPDVSDLEINILDSTSKDQGKSFIYQDVFPYTLSSPELDTVETDSVLCTATFAYTNLKIGDIEIERT